MIQTIEDILNNSYLNRFEEIAKSYQLEGVYIKYFTSQSKKEEIYFVCGKDKDRIQSDKLNVEETLSDSQKQYHLHNTNIAAFKLTGRDPLLTNQEILDYCQTTEFLSKLYEAYKMPLPALIPNGIVSGLKMAHYNATDPSLDKDTREAYIKDIRATLRKQDSLFTDHGSDKKRAMYYLHQQYDTQKSRLANWYKRTFGKDKNRVSMEHLVLTCKETSTICVSVSNYKQVQSELRNHPEIIYWMADSPIGQKLDCPDNQGYGSKKDNDRRYIAFAIDREYCKDFLSIANRIGYPDAYQTTEEKLTKDFSFVQHIAIHADDYRQYTEAMNSRGVKYCMEDNISSDPDIINLVIACNVQKNINEILQKIVSDNEKKHLYTSLDERKESAPKEYLDKQRTNLETALLKKASDVFGTNDVEFVSISGDLLSDEPAESR